jgi:hypothetical protein
VHIGTIIIQALGFGSDFANSFFLGSSDINRKLISDKDALRFKVAHLWLESLIQNGSAPDDPLGDAFTITDAAEAQFVEDLSDLMDNGSKYSWLSKRKDDIGPTKTPKLSVNYGEIFERSKGKKKKANYDELSPEIRNHFSENELDELMNQVGELLEAD